MEMVLYTVIAVVLYLVSDRILGYLESMYGKVLPYRSVIFFVIILILAVTVFSIMENIMMPEDGALLNNGSYPWSGR
ncbi:MAG: hypothetical protein H8D24_03620 [Gammaproteobacteria bacterium]|uniref:Uncharacterized protein n=1 Tax=Candidatus Thiopontia autotrophica TaxID=2841688 RepID=A0A8J6TXC0_9GAMM|nr:hypothetical protein [Candidatus Thiopontia autotrophica]MBL6969168.1 hypothetical protein [Gammaproteobacteria bacterium]